MNAAQWYLVAWRIAPHLPLWLVRGVAHRVADILVFTHARPVALLARNLQRLRGKPVPIAQVRAATRSHLRNYAEQFAMARLVKKNLLEFVDAPALPRIREAIARGPAVLAIPHAGNFDAAGGMFSLRGVPVVSVAERLNPPKLFDAFVNFRRKLGMTIIGAGPGERIFRTLVDAVRDQHVLVALLADRDITGAGIDVVLGSQHALVAAGPAALAKELDAPLYVGMIYYEHHPHLHVVVNIMGPIDAPGAGGGRTDVENHTQAWVDALTPELQKHAVDWHMMQRVYVEDLDPQRLRRSREKHQTLQDAP